MLGEGAQRLKESTLRKETEGRREEGTLRKGAGKTMWLQPGKLLCGTRGRKSQYLIKGLIISPTSAAWLKEASVPRGGFLAK